MHGVPTGEPFRFSYGSVTVRYGEGAVGSLASELAAIDCDRAAVVCGRTVGSTPAVMDPVRDGLGDRLATVFDETTPAKRLATAIDGSDRAMASDADALVAVGGGSSIDTAKAIAAIVGRRTAGGADSDPSVAALAEEFRRTGTLAVPDAPLPIVAVPTTLAGADLSQGAGLTATPENGLVSEHVDGGLGDPALLPAATVADPELVATTPRDVLASSAVNGFDKGLETLYSRHATPITDATAARGLARFREGLLAFDAETGEGASGYEAGLPAAVEGHALVQYGISRPDATTLGPIHALGQSLSAAGVHQGTAHAIVAPHLLDELFEQSDGRAALLVDALAPEASGDPAAAVVSEVRAVRDALGVPTRLRDVEAVERAYLPDVAAAAADHRFLANGPPDATFDAAAFERILEDAW